MNLYVKCPIFTCIGAWPVLDTIANGISNIIELNNNKSLCYTTCTYDNADLVWYKSRIVDKPLEKINWVIDAYNGMDYLSAINDIENFVFEHSSSLWLQWVRPKINV